MAKYFRGVTRGVSLVLVLASTLGATALYPSLGVFVEALSKELGWPVAPTTEGKIRALHAVEALSAHLGPHDPATPTVVMALTRNLLDRLQVDGKDMHVVLGAVARAAVATKAPIPTFPPEHVTPAPAHTVVVVVPDDQPLALGQPYPLAAIGPFFSVPFLEIPKGLPGQRFRLTDKPRTPLTPPLQEFPRTIFAPGEAPAQKGAGIFLRR